jgi:hypothetical protein
MSPTLRANARFYTPGEIAELLYGIASERDLTLVIDVDALERTQLARIESVMLLALDELERTGVEILLLARRGSPFRMRRFVQLHKDAEAVLRARRSAVLLVSDRRELFEALGPRDCGLALRLCLARANVAAADEAVIRAALWWLADARAREQQPLASVI